MQQSVVAGYHELNQPYELANEQFRNISIGLQFTPKRERQTAAARNMNVALNNGTGFSQSNIYFA